MARMVNCVKLGKEAEGLDFLHLDLRHELLDARRLVLDEATGQEAGQRLVGQDDRRCVDAIARQAARHPLGCLFFLTAANFTNHQN